MDRLEFIAQAIAKSKVIMDKVESGNFSRGHIDPSQVIVEGDLLESAPSGAQQYPQQAQSYTPTPSYGAESNPLTSAIAESFRKTPSLNPGGMAAVNTSNPLAMNMHQMDQVATAAKKMQGRGPAPLTAQQRKQLEEGYGPTANFSAPSEPAGQTFSQAIQNHTPVSHPAPGMLSEDYVKYLIEKTVEATVASTVKAVMEELYKPSAIDENIEIKIGGKLFGGKIKTLKG